MASPEITARDLWDRLHGAATQPFYVLDVRGEADVARWRVEGAVAAPTVNIPWSAFQDDRARALARVPRDLGEAVCVCKRGISSAKVRDMLVEAGIPAVSMAGGMIAWGDLHVPLRLDDGSDPTLELWQVSRYGKGCLSYAVVSGDEMAVVDPSRFVDVYLHLARARGARITEVLETHVHADHLSGGPLLARRSAARWRVRSGLGREPSFPGMPVEPLDDGEATLIGGALIEARAMHTPGHTPGSTCYVVASRWLFTGDTLFVNGVGRPDLGGQVEEWAHELHQSLHGPLARLAGHHVVLPAHFGGRRDAHADGTVHAPLAIARDRAPELRIHDRAEFVARMREGTREPPQAYADICAANLGLVDPGDKASEWELGRNECAAAGPRPEAPREGSSPPAG